MSDLRQREWYRCPHCAAEYRSEHARDCCVERHLEAGDE